MKSVFVISFAVIGLAGILVAYLRGNPQPIAGSATPLPIVSAEKSETPVAAAKSKARAIPPEAVAQIMSAPKVNWDIKDCEPYWKTITAVSFNDFSDAVATNRIAGTRQMKDVGSFMRMVRGLRTPEGCRGLPEGHPAGEVHQNVQMMCAAAVGDANGIGDKDPRLLLQSHNVQQCFLALQQYQATMQYLALGDTPVAKINDKAALNALLKAPAIGGALDVARKSEAAEKLLEMEPGNADAARLLVYNRLLEAHVSDDGGELKVKAAVELLEHADPRSPFGNEVRISLAHEKGDVGAIREIAAAMANNPEQKDLGAYYQAYASFLDNDVAGSKAKLTEIVSADPNNFVAQQALAKLNNPPPKGSPEPVFLEFVSQMQR